VSRLGSEASHTCQWASDLSNQYCSGGHLPCAIVALKPQSEFVTKSEHIILMPIEEIPITILDVPRTNLRTGTVQQQEDVQSGSEERPQRLGCRTPLHNFTGRSLQGCKYNTCPDVYLALPFVSFKTILMFTMPSLGYSLMVGGYSNTRDCNMILQKPTINWCLRCI
jgi:hypothetical protein